MRTSETPHDANELSFSEIDTYADNGTLTFRAKFDGGVIPFETDQYSAITGLQVAQHTYASSGAMLSEAGFLADGKTIDHLITWHYDAAGKLESADRQYFGGPQNTTIHDAYNPVTGKHLLSVITDTVHTQIAGNQKQSASEVKQRTIEFDADGSTAREMTIFVNSVLVERDVYSYDRHGALSQVAIYDGKGILTETDTYDSAGHMIEAAHVDQSVMLVGLDGAMSSGI